MSADDEVIRITAAGLLPTYWCSARCAHCYELSSPRRSGWMTLDDARSHLAALRRLGADPAGIHIGGGEPFGNYPLLVDIVRAAREVGLDGLGYVETNGYWATDDELARRRLTELRDAGLRQLSLSADVFHQSYVDPACLTRLWTVARDVFGPRGVRARRWRFLKAPLDLRAATDDERRAAYAQALAEHAERMTGRAARELAPLVPGRPAARFAGELCSEALRDSGHVHVDPNGYVFPGTCAGLLLGRASATHPLDAILAAPRGQLWRLLVAGGPVQLLALAASLGYRELPGGYADKCHLCTSVRKFLYERGQNAEELGPREMYAEE
jgi:hypothetical protein